MKKILAIMLTITLAFAMTACSPQEEQQPEENIDYEIAMITDSGLIMDGGYSQMAWEAITEFGSDEGISHKYFKATDSSMDSCRAAIDTAVSKGAKIVLLHNYHFDDITESISDEKYKNIKFILIDCDTLSSQNDDIEKNVTAVLFSSQQAGYLAGYGAAKEGYTNVGFMGEQGKQDISNYGYGFLQGLERGAAEIETEINAQYTYCDEKQTREDIVDKATEWYTAGTQIIFACGSTVEEPVVEVAEMMDRQVIGCDVDKSTLSDTIVSSAEKNYKMAISELLKQYFDDEFPEGTLKIYNASNEGVSLELENSRFSNFTKEDYENVYNELAEGAITVKDVSAGDISQLALSRVKVM